MATSLFELPNAHAFLVLSAVTAVNSRPAPLTLNASRQELDAAGAAEAGAAAAAMRAAALAAAVSRPLPCY